ncbi:hypothetical protein B296_00016513 [Ensete ventricosum]|uniref:Uncharacterized protein n=1 Tax=Ensete ventricosum TaxID=4639 RepID=A0A426Z322_ENSVE|nr:hypothetical protein B296_00016513 [Ensete ventricosum]
MSKNLREKERTSFTNSSTQSKSEIKKKKITWWFRDQDDGKEVEKASELALVEAVGRSVSSGPPSSLSRADAAEHLVVSSNVIQLATSWRRNTFCSSLSDPNRPLNRFPLGLSVSR